MNGSAIDSPEIASEIGSPEPVDRIIGGDRPNRDDRLGDVSEAHTESIPPESTLDLAKTEEPNRVKGPWLRNGNRPGNPANAPRCGAKARTRGGVPCRNAAMPNGRCRLHGGASTGPRTAEGKRRAAQANWKHGKRSQATIAARRAARAELRRIAEETKQLGRELNRRLRQQQREREQVEQAEEYVILLPAVR
jgi:hypothetical protein